MTRERLDQVLVEQGLYASRARARDAVERGEISVAGKTVTRPGVLVDRDAAIVSTDPARAYVSRSALKLKAALEAFEIDAAGALALDVGASTGGFTQILLERGAAHVTAIDVGHGQLVATLAGDPRVTSIEGLNARDLTEAHLAYRPTLVVADVSFISLSLALPPALALASDGASVIALVKPQFEVGRENIGKGGLVRDAALALKAVDDVATLLSGLGWREIGRIASPIAGGDGNQEYLIGARRS